jgi:hypothetical protein
MKSPASCRKRSRADAAAAVEGGLIRAAFLAGVAQHRRLKKVDAAGFPDEGEFRWGGSLLVACAYALPP